METLYALCVADEGACTDAMLAEFECWEELTLDRQASRVWVSGFGGRVSIQIHRRPLTAEVEDAILAFQVHQETPEDVGLAWTLVQVAATACDGLVWLSGALFDVESIGATLKRHVSHRLLDTLDGALLRADEFELFAERR